MENNLLEIRNLTKKYPAFSLDRVSFSVGNGEIMGFIGRNGAGKSTTLKSVMNLVHPDGGEVLFFGKTFGENEAEIKENVGYALGEVNYFFRKKVGEIVSVTKRFYKNWDEGSYAKYMRLFALDENKRLADLSCGMKVKFNLVLALSHNAKLIILDEPTSGLDPVSREELLDIFLDLAEEGVSILFSTHIIGDLEKCAGKITYIHKGQILYTGETDDFCKRYLLVSFEKDALSRENEALLLGVNKTKDGRTGLILAENAQKFDGFGLRAPTLEEIMTHIEKEG